MRSCLWAVSCFLMASCNFYQQKQMQDANALLNKIEAIDFSAVRDGILVPSCVRCHDQYSNYDVVRAELQNIWIAIEQNRMPKSGELVSSDYKKILRAWIDQGAPLVANQPPPEILEEPLLPVWDSIYKKIFIPKCVVCHSPKGQAPWVDVSSREAMEKTLVKHMNFQDPESSYLVQRLKDEEEPMPPPPPQSNIPRLTSDEVKVVVEWIQKKLP